MSKWLKVCVLGDNHGDLVQRSDADQFFKFCADFKPHHRIHLGDNWDFRNLRRGADPREEGDDIEPDITAGFLFLERFQPTVFLLGNHDHRLWKATQDARGIVRQFARDCVKQIETRCKQMGCRIYPYDSEAGVHRLGDTAFLHGYHAGIGATLMHARIFGRCVFGHLHRNDMAVAPRHGERAYAWCTGGVGDHTKMDYARQRTATLAWGSGWIFGETNGTTTVLWQAAKIGNEWKLPRI